MFLGGFLVCVCVPGPKLNATCIIPVSKKRNEKILSFSLIEWICLGLFKYLYVRALTYNITLFLCLSKPLPWWLHLHRNLRRRTKVRTQEAYADLREKSADEACRQNLPQSLIMRLGKTLNNNVKRGEDKAKKHFMLISHFFFFLNGYSGLNGRNRYWVPNFFFKL